MKRVLIVGMILAASSCVFAQESGNTRDFQTAGPVVSVGVGGFIKGSTAPIQGAPYSATITNENIQTLEDGNRIVQTSTGNTARDSQGRTRQDTPLPAIGDLSAANAPHLVFIQDPVAQTAYTLNLTDKIAQKMPTVHPIMSNSDRAIGGVEVMDGGPGQVVIQMGTGVSAGDMPPMGIVMHKTSNSGEQGQAKTEDLGTQTMEGVLVTGVRTTRTIPAGAVGNDKPISIVTEVWTSPDLKTIVYSKRSDPRMGEQTFQLKNVVRTEPDASLFTVPADFKIVDGPQTHDVIYRSNH